MTIMREKSVSWDAEGEEKPNGAPGIGPTSGGTTTTTRRSRGKGRERGRGTRTSRRSTAAAACLVAVAVAAAAVLTVLLLSLLFPNSLGTCHRHDDDAARPSSDNWSHGFTVPSDRAAGTASSGFEVQISNDGPSDIELRRRLNNNNNNNKVGMARRQSASATASSTTSATLASASASGTVLVDFQVHQPVLTPEGATLDSGVSNGEAGEVEDACQVVVMDHIFAYSYGEPYIGIYTPPDCEFNRVAMNFTVVSEGRQFDRLALMYLNDTEVWRTSTAEPTTAPGIRWTYMKDMTEYLSLWKEPQKLIFDLGNLITDVYTGDYNTTLTVTFFNDTSVDVATAPPADLIIPISARQSASDGVSQFTLPADNATNTISFPQNVKRAVFSVSANGQSSEEFWWSNVLASDVGAFASTAGTFPGYSPWREVQVFIDGQLAGVQWPFPVVFTGGVVPSLHRPVVGPDAFDLKEHEIDITPWLGVLCDGADHTFTIYVAGLLDNGGTEASVTQTVGSSWYVTGKIFVWLDEEGSVTTGSAPVVDAAAPEITVSQVLTQTANGTNETLTYDTQVSRTYTVSAKVASQNSSSTVSWSQSLTYSNKGYVWAAGYSQINDFVISGSDEATTGTSSSSPAAAAVGANYKSQYKYPLYCNTSYSYSAEGNLTIYAQLIQGQQVYVEGAAVFPDGLEAFAVNGTSYNGSLLSNTKDGIAYFFEYADSTSSSGYGSTDETFSFGGFTGSGGSIDATPDEQLYYRHVKAANSTVTSDVQLLAQTDVGTGINEKASSASGYKSTYAQTPLGGGHGAPRMFTNRQTS